MAKKEKVDYRQLSEDELRQKLAESKEKLFQMRFQSATAPLKNPHQIAATRRDIARIHTILREREIAGSAKAS